MNSRAINTSPSSSSYLPGLRINFEYMHEFIGEDFSTWKLVSLKGNPPQLRDKYCVDVDADTLFLFGGCCGPDPRWDGEIYTLNLTSLAWSKRSVTSTINPGGILEPSCFIRQGQFMVYGGTAFSSRTPNVLWQFNPVNDAWTRITYANGSPLETFGSIGYFNNTLYHYGGCSRFACTNAFWTFNFDTSTWTKDSLVTSVRPSIPSSSRGIITVVGPLMYIYCASTSAMGWALPSYTMNVIDLRNKTILEYIELPVSGNYADYVVRPYVRSYGNLIPSNGSLILTGSILASFSDPSMWKFNPGNRLWTPITGLRYPSDTLQHSSCTIGNNIYMFGGNVLMGFSVNNNQLWKYDTLVEEWEVISNYSTSFLEDGGNYPYPLVWSTMICRSDSIYIFGGLNEQFKSKPTAYVFDLGSRVWKSIKLAEQPSHSPFHRLRAHSWDMGPTVYVWGGSFKSTVTADLAKAMYAIDMETFDWKMLSVNGTSPNARTYAARFTYKQDICFYGGEESYNPKGDLWCYRPGNNTWVTITPILSNCPPISQQFSVFRKYLLMYQGTSPSDVLSGYAIFDIEKRTCQLLNPSLSKLPTQTDSFSHAVGSKWYIGMGPDGDYGVGAMRRAVSSINLAFCETETLVNFNGLYDLTDGSAAYDIIPGSHCVWKASSVSFIRVNAISIGKTSKLTLDSFGNCISSNQTSAQVELTGFRPRDVINTFGQDISISLKAGFEEDSPMEGFSVTLIQCPRGFSWDETCYCPGDHFITFQGDCLPCLGSFSGAVNQTSCEHSRSSTPSFASTRPTARMMGASVSLGDRIITLGGYQTAEKSTESIHSFESIFEATIQEPYRWYERRASGDVPSARAGFCALAIQERIYMFGGKSASFASANIYSLDPASLIWSNLGQSMVDYEGAMSTAVNNYIFVHGGLQNGSALSSTWKFDTNSKSWSLITSRMAPKLAYASNGFYGDSWFFVGGFDGMTNLDSIWSFNLEKLQWAKITPGFNQCSRGIMSNQLAHSRAAFAAQSHELYIYGGIREDKALSRMMVYDMKENNLVYWQDDTSAEPTNYMLPPPKVGSSAVIIGSALVIISGSSSDSYCLLDDVFVWDAKTRRWRDNGYKHSPVPRKDATFFHISSNKLGLYGGSICRPHDVVLGDIWEYDIDTRTWTLLLQPKESFGIQSFRIDALGTYYENKVYIIGGRNLETKFSDSMIIYNLDTTSVTEMNTTMATSSNGRTTRSYSLTASIPGRMWILLGDDSNTPLITSLLYFDGSTSSLMEIPTLYSLSATKEHSAAFVFNNTLCVYQQSPFTIEIVFNIDCFDTVAKRWESKFSGKTLPRLSIPMLFPLHSGIAIMGRKSTKSTQIDAFWMLNTGNNIPVKLDEMQLSALYQTTQVIGNDNMVYALAGKSKDDHQNTVTFIQPQFCLRGASSVFLGNQTLQIFDDGSQSSNYIPGTICSWTILKSTHLLLKRNIYQSDVLKITPEQLQPSNRANTFNSIDDVIIFHNPDGGFTIDFMADPSFKTGLAGFQAKHIECAKGASLVAEVCQCPEGKIVDGNLECSSEADSSQEIYLLAILLPCSVVALILVFLVRKYRERRRNTVRKGIYNSSETIDIQDIILHESLGSGSIAETLHGEWRKSPIAFKKLHNQKLSKETTQGLHEEILALCQLRHPNIILYLGYCTSPNHTGYVMELMKNNSLYEFLQENVTINFSTKMRILRDIIQGLSFLHSSNPIIVHGNLKSSNILLDDHLSVKISDFHLSLHKSDTDDLKKGFEWFSPEAINSAKISTKSDVYSFGIILWELITGKRPYGDVENKFAIMIKAVQGQARPEIPPSVPTQLRKVMESSWSQKPDQRPRIQDIQTQLKSMLSDEALQTVDRPHFAQNTGAGSSYEGAIISIRIEAAIRMWDENPHLMEASILTFNDLIRKSVSKHHGKECFTEADEHIIQFMSPREALVFALEIQELMNMIEWPSDMVQLHPGAHPGLFRGLLPKIGIDATKISINDFHNNYELGCSTDALYSSTVLCLNARGGEILISGAIFKALQADLATIGDPMVQRHLTPLFYDEMRSVEVYEAFPRNLVERASFFAAAESSSDPSLPSGVFSVMHQQDRQMTAEESLPSLNQPGSKSNEGSRSLSFFKERKHYRTKIGRNVAGLISDKFFKLREDLTRLRCEIQLEDLQMVDSDRIGMGQSGVVFKGSYKKQQVAIKRLHHQSTEERYYTAFLSEISIARKVNHPNLVRFIGAHTKVPNLLIITELVSGGNLHTIITNPSSKLDTNAREKIVVGIARGMAHLHNMRPPILHRDLNPSNVLMSPDGNPKICDFGLSKIKSQGIVLSQVGTIGYQAPEVLLGQHYDEKADVYSFAIIVWELCNLKLAFEKMDALAVAQFVTSGMRPDPLPSRTDKIYIQMVSDCWDQDPRQRPDFVMLSDWKDYLQKKGTK